MHPDLKGLMTSPTTEDQSELEMYQPASEDCIETMHHTTDRFSDEYPFGLRRFIAPVFTLCGRPTRAFVTGVVDRLELCGD
jgi:hypothetical protein